MFKINDDNSIEIVRGDSADFDIYLPTGDIDYIIVTNPSGSPEENRYYEIMDNQYVLSEDDIVDPNKTYYTVQQEEYELQPGDTLLFTVKKNTKTDDVLIQKSGPHIEIGPSDTEGLKYGVYKYDVELTYASGFVDTVILPTDFKITEEVTFPHVR
jgi:hypothetical protein